MTDHTHGPDGTIIWAETPEPEAVEAEAVETVADAEVEIAKIQADTEVKLAKEATKREEMWQESRVAELEGEMKGMREILDKLMPEPEPEPEPAPAPIVVPEPEAAPAVEPPPVAEEKPNAGKRKSGGMFSWPS